MKQRKTYGVTGLMEWHAILTAGKAKVHVDFTGGALTGYGVTPAEYSTEDPFIQAVIENSSYYKTGRIATLRTIILEPEEVKEEKAEKEEAVEVLTVAVGSLDDARDYLVEHHGMNASSLRSKKSILENGAKVGVQFEGL